MEGVTKAVVCNSYTQMTENKTHAKKSILRLFILIIHVFFFTFIQI